ncbi:MAG: transposase [Chitinophagaceae bacterium]|nr:transposase [Chitinophagaceae bacterium]
MKRTRFTESQIVASIKKQESGIPAKDVCRELGISDATFTTESQIWRHGNQ